ncbi:hypothetical protein Tco_0402081 [Tanacetum coccineum]
MDTKEASDRFVAPCFINGLEAYDGEINLRVKENMISNEYAFIINPEEDDVEPGVILGRSFLRFMSTSEGEEDSEKGGHYLKLAKFLILDIPIDRDAPIVVGRGFLCTIGGIVNTKERFFSTFDGFCHQTFRAARSDAMRNAESDSDDEEEYQIKRNNFGALIYELKPAPYLNCNNPTERSLDIQTVTNPFRKISVWKKAVSFLGSLPVPLKHVNWKPDYKGSYTKEEEEATRQ